MESSLYGLKRIYFGGFFIRGRHSTNVYSLPLPPPFALLHSSPWNLYFIILSSFSCLPSHFSSSYFTFFWIVTMDMITFAVDYWGKGEIEALFLRHEGYIGK